MANSPRWVAAGQSDPGLVRERNEDRWFADVDRGLFIVADGMGGHAAGALAAEIVVQSLPPLLEERLGDSPDLADPQTHERVRAALIDLSRQLRDASTGEFGLDGMGSTVVMALLNDDHALIAHLGDSRACLLRNGQLRQLTRDHSIVQLLVNHGEITESEATHHPARNQLTHFVGMEAALPDVCCCEIQPDDLLLLCSDGITGQVGVADLLKHTEPRIPPDEICRRLVHAANAAGGQDNETVVTIRVTAPASH